MRFQKLSSLYNKLPFFLFLRFVLADTVRKILLPQGRLYFAQGAEDINIMYILEKYNSGFYIDIGSNDPIAYSNTFKLYLQGWNGILVDGNKALIEKAKTIRKKDICVHGIVSNEKREMTFHISDDSLMSSVDPAFGTGNGKSFSMETISVNDIIDRHLEKGKKIDLLSIDVEGHDFEVLQSIDLNLHRPSCIIIEDLGYVQKPVQENTYFKYLAGFAYHLAGADKQNLIFVSNEYQSGKQA